MSSNRLDEAVQQVREQLLDDAHLFADPASYRAGVKDALEGLQNALDDLGDARPRLVLLDETSTFEPTPTLVSHRSETRP